MSLPFGVTEIEKAAVKRAGLSVGAREVILVDEPMAAAFGASLPVDQPRGSMIIDIGGGTTEVAVVSLYGIVHCEAVRIGGHRFDQAIVDYIRKQHNLVIGEPSAERLKLAIGAARADLPLRTETVRGMAFNGLPRALEISSFEIFRALDPLLAEIGHAGRRTLEETPPELIADLAQDGIVISGGGALLPGLKERFEEELKLPVRIDADPLRTLARGGERIIQSGLVLQRVELQ